MHQSRLDRTFALAHHSRAARLAAGTALVALLSVGSSAAQAATPVTKSPSTNRPSTRPASTAKPAAPPATLPPTPVTTGTPEARTFGAAALNKGSLRPDASPTTIPEVMPTAVRDALATQEGVSSGSSNGPGRLDTSGSNSVVTLGQATGLPHSDLQTMTNGQVVDTLEHSPGFVHVRMRAGTEFWIPITLLPDLATGPSARLEPGGRIVLGKSMTTATEPRVGAMRRESLMAGDTMTVIERDGAWLLVRGPSGHAGWVLVDDVVGLGPAIERRLRAGGSNVSRSAPGG